MFREGRGKIRWELRVEGSALRVVLCCLVLVLILDLGTVDYLILDI